MTDLHCLNNLELYFLLTNAWVPGPNLKPSPVTYGAHWT